MNRMPAKERRRHHRVNVKVDIRTIDLNRPALHLVTDLSVGGIFIPTDKPAAPGMVFGIELSTQGLHQPLFLKGRVVRVVKSGDGAICGMGIEFLDIPPRESHRLGEVVHSSTGNSSTILVVTGDQRLDHMIRTTLAKQGHQVLGVHGLTVVSNAHDEHEADLVVFDLGDPERGLYFLRSEAGVLPMVIMCNHLGPELQAKAASYGIYEILEKPVDPNQLLSAVTRELQCSKLERIAGSHTSAPLVDMYPMVARSHCMQELRKNVLRIAKVQQPVLIVGETGTGKEMVARANNNMKNHL